MAKKLVIRNKTSAELIELGFIGCENSSYCYKREQNLSKILPISILQMESDYMRITTSLEVVEVSNID